jgi:hypothetical protein
MRGALYEHNFLRHACSLRSERSLIASRVAPDLKSRTSLAVHRQLVRHSAMTTAPLRGGR